VWALRFFVLGVSALWVAGVGASLFLASGDLVAAKQALEQGQAALGEADLAGATAALAEAEARAGGGLQQLRAPHVRLAAAVPVLGDSIRTVDAIAEGVAEVGGAANGLVTAVERLPDGVDSLRPRDGVFPIDGIQQLAPHVSDVATTLRLAVTRVEEAPDDYVFGPIARERDQFIAIVAPVAVGAEKAMAIAEHLPPFLGSDGPRRYVFVASNPAEPRGTGGYFGSYAVMVIDQGAFELGGWTPAYDLETRLTRDIDPPNPSYARRYDPFGGAGFWQNINMTPDFPTAASAIVRLWEHVHGEAVDGVIAVDPFALQALLEVAGAIEVGGRSIDADTVIPYVTNEAYEELGEGSERQEIIGEVAGATLETYLHTPEIDALAQAVEPLSRAAASGHLLLYSVDPEEQRAFRTAGVDGGFPDPSGDIVGFAVNDGSATKIDYYGQRSIEYEAQLLRHGRVAGRLAVEFTNEAPTDGRSRHIIGPNVSGLDPGEMRFLASAFCSPTCRLIENPQDEGRESISREQEFLFVDFWVRIPSGGETTLHYAWETDGAWRAVGDTIEYRLAYDDQVTIRPTPLRIRVHVPDGFEPVALPGGARVEDGAVVWEREGERGDVELRLRFRPTA
jgi:hypothetical protein